MPPATATVLVPDGGVLDAELADGRVVLGLDALEAATGWHLEEQGLCRAEACVPVRDRERLVVGGGVDVAELGSVLALPVVVDADAGVAALGDPAEHRAEALASLEAPAFTLPGLDGEPVALDDYAGRKRMLLAWASW